MKQAVTRDFYKNRLKAVLHQLKAIFSKLSGAELVTLQGIQARLDLSEAMMDKPSKKLQQQIKQWRKKNEMELGRIIQMRDLYRKVILFVMYLEMNVKDLLNEEFHHEFLPGLNSYVENLELYLLRRNQQAEDDDLVLLKKLADPGNIFAKGYLKIAASMKQKLVADAVGLYKAVTSSNAFHMGKKVAVETGKRVKKHAVHVATGAYAGAKQTGKRLKRAADDAIVEAVMGPIAKNPRLIFQQK